MSDFKCIFIMGLTTLCFYKDVTVNGFLCCCLRCVQKQAFLAEATLAIITQFFSKTFDVFCPVQNVFDQTKKFGSWPKTVFRTNPAFIFLRQKYTKTATVKYVIWVTHSITYIGVWNLPDIWNHVQIDI